MTIKLSFKLATLPPHFCMEARGRITTTNGYVKDLTFKNGRLSLITDDIEVAQAVLKDAGIEEGYVYETHLKTQNLGMPFRFLSDKIDDINDHYNGADWVYSDANPWEVEYLFESSDAAKLRRMSLINLDNLGGVICQTQTIKMPDGTDRMVYAEEMFDMFNKENIGQLQCGLGVVFTLAEYIDYKFQKYSHMDRTVFKETVELMVSFLLEGISAQAKAENIIDELNGRSGTDHYQDITVPGNPHYKVKDGPNAWEHATFVGSIEITKDCVYDVGYQTNEEKTEYEAVVVSSSDHSSLSILHLTDCKLNNTVSKEVIARFVVTRTSPFTILGKVVLNHLLEKGLVKLPK